VDCSCQHRISALLAFFFFSVERITCALLWYSHMIGAVYLLRDLGLLDYGALNFVSTLKCVHNSIVILSVNCFPPVHFSLSKPDVLLSLNVQRSTVHVFGCVES